MNRTECGVRMGMVALALLVANAPKADVATLVASRDATLYESPTGALANGAGLHLFAGRTAQFADSIRRGLVFFNLAGNIPSGSAITSVTLTLNLSKTQLGTRTVTLHKVQKDWGEGTSDAALNEGVGAAATTGDATWVHTFYNTVSWTTPGGDFVATDSASQAVGSTLGLYTWGSTAQLVQDVQGWLNAPATNFGWLVQGEEALASTAKRFDTHEEPTPANRPTLTVVFTPPSAGMGDWMVY